MSMATGTNYQWRLGLSIRMFVYVGSMCVRESVHPHVHLYANFKFSYLIGGLNVIKFQFCF